VTIVASSSSRKIIKHGTRRGYALGCRCKKCRDIESQHKRDWHLQWWLMATPEEVIERTKRTRAWRRDYKKQMPQAQKVKYRRRDRKRERQRVRQPWNRLSEDVRKKTLARIKRYRRRVRIKVLMHYGGRCSCCGESELAFLTVAHKLNNGNKDTRFKKAKRRFGGLLMYLKIIRLGYPEDLTALCWNCNSGAYFNYGVCPHKTNGAANSKNRPTAHY
jgi:hypothetical protein